MELGKKIYQLRKLSGMTQEQLAEKLSISTYLPQKTVAKQYLYKLHIVKYCINLIFFTSVLNIVKCCGILRGQLS